MAIQTPEPLELKDDMDCGAPDCCGGEDYPTCQGGREIPAVGKPIAVIPLSALFRDTQPETD